MTRAKLVYSLAAAALLSLAPAAAQTPPAQRPAPGAKPALESPYKPVPITATPALADPSFAAFQQQLAAAAKDRIYGRLERLVVPEGFFWDGDFAGRFDAKRTPAENVAAAIGLEHEDGSGWTSLARFAAVADAAPPGAHPGVVCAPTPPVLDDMALYQLLDSTQTSAADWLYPRSAGAPMRLAARPASGVVEMLGMHLVRLLGTESTWVRVAAPSGKTGFVAPGTLSPLRSDRLCYLKDVTGRWAIAGYIAAAN
jgi:hypothetical protein